MSHACNRAYNQIFKNLEIINSFQLIIIIVINNNNNNNNNHNNIDSNFFILLNVEH